MIADKWQIINGHVYKLVENPRGVRIALNLVRKLRRDNHVLVRLVGDGSWLFTLDQGFSTSLVLDLISARSLDKTLQALDNYET